MNPRTPFHLLLLSALLYGCGATPSRNTPAPVVRSGQVPTQPPESAKSGPSTSGEEAGVEVYAYRQSVPTPKPSARNPAVVALETSADRQRRAGDLDGAVASLERALRVDSRDPLLWHQLARLRLTQGRYGMAADLAAKSNALAGTNRELKRENWSLIAEARRAEGDSAGARAATMKVREF